MYLRISINEEAGLMPKVKRRFRLGWWKFRNCNPVLCDILVVPLELKVWMLKVDVLEVIFYGCATWSTKKDHHDERKTAYRS